MYFELQLHVAYIIITDLITIIIDLHILKSCTVRIGLYVQCTRLTHYTGAEVCWETAFASF